MYTCFQVQTTHDLNCGPRLGVRTIKGSIPGFFGLGSLKCCMGPLTSLPRSI